MKRWILTALFLCLTLAAQAQYVQRKGSHLVQDGQKLSEEQTATLLSDIDGIDYYPDWKSAKAWRGTGLGLTIGGSVVVGVGTGVFLVGALTSMMGAVIGGAAGAIGGGDSASAGAEQGAKAGQPLMTGGLISVGVGIVALGVGIPVLAVNTKKMNGIVGAYNATQAPQEPTATLSFGPTASGGIGLALNF